MIKINDLEISIRNYLNRLISRYFGIKEIWLFGSRANNWIHEKSDWDFIVKSDKATFDSLKIDTELKNDADLLMIKLLVGPDKNGYFQNAWKRQRLSFRKDSLNWREIGPGLAEYEACDFDVSGEEAKAKGLAEGITSFRAPHAKAYRIWP
jgi:predicted nucleotidyltransferase